MSTSVSITLWSARWRPCMPFAVSLPSALELPPLPPLADMTFTRSRARDARLSSSATALIFLLEAEPRSGTTIPDPASGDEWV